MKKLIRTININITNLLKTKIKDKMINIKLKE